MAIGTHDVCKEPYGRPGFCIKMREGKVHLPGEFLFHKPPLHMNQKMRVSKCPSPPNPAGAF